MYRLLPLAAVPVLVAGAVWPTPPPPPLAVAALAGVLATLGVAGWRLSHLLLPPGAHAPATRWTAAAVFATVLATLPATLLGHFGLLRPEIFLLWGCLLALGTALLPARTAERRDPSPALPRLPAVERAVAIAAFVLLAVSALSQIRTDRYQPPGYYGFDDNSYHLSTVATWLDTGDLSMIRFSYGDDATPFYPIVGELVAWVLVAPFGDLDVAARWGQLPFALATLAAMAALAGRLGLRLRHALPALALYGSLFRVFPLLALGAGNDHATAFFTLAAVDGLLAAARRRTAGAGVYAGTALGLLVGTKYLGLLFLPPILAVGAVAWLAAGRGRTFVPLLAGSAAAALAGGYTYLRNWATTGNPLFPAPLTVAGIEIFSGWKHASIAWRRKLPEGAIDLPEFLFRSDLWGTVPPWLLVSAAVAAPLLAIGGAVRAATVEEARRRAVEAAILLLPTALFLVFLLLVHDHRDIRYLLPGIAVAALGVTHLAGGAGRPGGSALRIVTYAAALASLFEWQALAPGEALPRLAASLAIGTAVALWPAAWRRPVLSPRALRWATVTLALVLYPVAVHVTERYPERKLENRQLPLWLEKDADGPATVAYVGFNSPYLFWGSRLQNDVVVVPVRRALDARLYGWGSPLRSPFRHGTYGQWRRNLERLGVDYVVVVKVGGENPERRWMTERPDTFTKAAELGETEIWKVNLPARNRRSGEPRSTRPTGS